MPLLDTGSNTAGVANVNSTYSLETTLKDSSGNKSGRTQREQFGSTQEALLVAGKNDDFATMIRTDRKGNILTGNYNPELFDFYEGATINVQKWTLATSGFVQAQTTLAGFNYVSTAITTSGAYSIKQSQRLLYKMPRVPLQTKKRLRHSMVSGTIADFGFGVPATTTLVVPNGTCFRFTNSGVVQGVITYNSNEIAIANVVSKTASNGNTIGGNLNMSNSYYTSNYFVYDIVIDDDNAIFTIQDTQTGDMVGYLSLPVPNGYQKMWGATGLPEYTRVYNATVPSVSPIFIETEMQALSLDMNYRADASQIAGNLGMTAGRNPFTGAQLENHTNSTAPTSATLSNTAAGYTTMGGKWQFAAVAGAVTDYALFGVTIPAGSKFLCEGIRIESRNTVAAVATTSTTLEWSMGFNSSAVSLATANIIRRQIGTQVFPIGAAIDATATPIDVTFITPEVVESGRFLHVILTIPTGTATATEIFRGQVLIKGRFI